MSLDWKLAIIISLFFLQWDTRESDFVNPDGGYEAYGVHQAMLSLIPITQSLLAADLVVFLTKYVSQLKSSDHPPVVVNNSSNFIIAYFFRHELENSRGDGTVHIDCK